MLVYIKKIYTKFALNLACCLIALLIKNLIDEYDMIITFSYLNKYFFQFLIPSQQSNFFFGCYIKPSIS